MSEPIDTAEDTIEPVLAYEGNCSLREEIGADFKAANYITEQKIQACEELLVKAVEEFFTDAEPDLQALERMTRELTADTIEKHAHQLQTHAYNIKSLAKVLGFTLITEICIHLVATIGSPKLSAEKRKAILQNLASALRLTFMQRIRDDGGEVGKELLANLRKHV